MSNPKARTDKGIILFKDYSFMFNLMSDEHVGKTIKLLLENFNNKKYKHDPCEIMEVNSAFNYIANRVNDYFDSSRKSSEAGRLGGNPTLKGTHKLTDKGGVKPIEDKIIEDKIIETNKTRVKKFVTNKELPDELSNSLIEWLIYKKLAGVKQFEYQYKAFVKCTNPVEAVEHSIGNGYKGLFEPKKSQNNYNKVGGLF